VTGVMGSRYERYIFHMCTMKIVAKLISFEQIQPSKKQILETIFYNTKIKKLQIWKQEVLFMFITVIVYFVRVPL